VNIDRDMDVHRQGSTGIPPVVVWLLLRGLSSQRQRAAIGKSEAKLWVPRWARSSCSRQQKA